MEKLIEEQFGDDYFLFDSGDEQLSESENGEQEFISEGEEEE